MIPDSIHIGAHTFGVQLLPKEQMPGELGSCYRNDLLIKIRSDLPFSLQQETLVHEMVHAMRWITGTELEDEKEEERTVQVLSHLLFEVLKSNRFVWTETTHSISDSPVPRGISSPQKSL